MFRIEFLPTIRVAILTVLAVVTQSGTARIQGTYPQPLGTPALTRTAWVEVVLKGMTIEAKIGQMLQVRVYGDYPDFNEPAYRYAIDQIRRYNIGSVDLAARMAGPNLVKGTPVQVATILNEFQRQAKIPLLVGADIERGLASRLSDVPDFPFPMSFGAASDPEMVERFAEISAREARSVGIQWAFAPVADVNNNPANPIINVRSFGEDPRQVCRLVRAYIEGTHHGGLLVAVKHFPGHGDSSADSHVGMVRIDGDREHLRKYELPPFQEAIAAHADSILLAHAFVPAFDSDPNRITTTSSSIMNGLLRRDLNFHGVILTDALEMRGLMALYPHDSNPSGRAAVDAIKAGADVLMLPKDLDATFYSIVAAVRSGEISEGRLDESVRRILTMKAQLGLDKSRLVDIEDVRRRFPDREGNDLAQRVADDAVTLIRSNGAVLPLSKQSSGSSSVAAVPASSGLVIISFTDSITSRLGHEFDRQIKAYRPDAKLIHYYNDHVGSDAAPDEALSQVKAADRVVVAAFLTHAPGRQIMSHGRAATAVGLDGEGAELVENALHLAAKKTVVVALGSPYMIVNYPEIQNYICTYSLTSTAESAAVKALFGGIQNHAKLPVTIPGVADRGFHLPWPRQTLN